jgi:hypothetical protein
MKALNKKRDSAPDLHLPNPLESVYESVALPAELRRLRVTKEQSPIGFIARRLPRCGPQRRHYRALSMRRSRRLMIRKVLVSTPAGLGLQVGCNAVPL